MPLLPLFNNSRTADLRQARPQIDAPISLEAESSSADSADESEGRSINLSRFKSYFERPGEDLFIELEEPHKIYAPGDQVRGKVILTLHKPTKTLFTALTFRGQVSLGLGKQVAKTLLFQDHIVLWGQRTPDVRTNGDTIETAETHDIETRRTSDTPDRTVSNPKLDQTPKASISIPAQKLSWEAGCMDPGRHIFEFEFYFPQTNLPSTIDFGRGSITYTLRCDHQKPRALTSRGRSSCRKNLIVLDNIDIGHLPLPKVRHINPDLKLKRREDTGKVQAVVDISRAGFLKGETIALNIKVDHIKPIKNMKGTIATLYRLSRFDSPNMAPQSFRKDLCQTISPLLVDPRSLCYKISPRLRIPADVFPTTKSAGPVSFRYFVEVVLDLNGRTTVWQGGPGSSMVDAVSNYSIETGGEAMETDALKRDRGAHCVLFEVVIGTKDTSFVEPRRPALEQQSSSRSYQPRPTSDTSGSPRTHLEQQGLSETDSSLGLVQGISTSATSQTDSGLRGQSQFPRTKADLQRLESALSPSMPPPSDEPSHQSFSPSAPILEPILREQVASDRQSPNQDLCSGFSESMRSLLLRPADLKEEEALRERASAPPDQGEAQAGSAPGLELLATEEDSIDHDSIDLPIYRGRLEVGGYETLDNLH